MPARAGANAGDGQSAPPQGEAGPGGSRSTASEGGQAGFAGGSRSTGMAGPGPGESRAPSELMQSSDPMSRFNVHPIPSERLLEIAGLSSSKLNMAQQLNREVRVNMWGDRFLLDEPHLQWIPQMAGSAFLQDPTTWEAIKQVLLSENGW